MRLHEFSSLLDFLDVFTEMKYSNKVISVIIILSHYTCKHGLCSASCTRPEAIPNTMLLGNQTLDTGSYITWECMEGYVMQGNTNTVLWVCLENGTWLGNNATCKVIECPSPPIAAYSELETPLTSPPVVNQTIRYACSSNEYTLMDNTGNRCLMDGTWENVPPVCQRYCDETRTPIDRYSDLACYRRRSNGDPINWQEALELCIEKGELLATIKNAETQAFLVEFTGSKIGNDVWIGAMEGRDWKWRNSNKYIERFYWQSPFPGGGRDDCIELSYQDGSFFWSPRSRSNDVAFICQYDRHCQSMDLDISNMVLEYMGNCFQFIDDPMNCRDAARECEGMGGFLAEIYDESTNALLAERALYLKDNKLADGPWWIGGYDEDTNQRSWFWSDQTRMIFDAAWRHDEPSGDGDCVEMREQGDFQYQWNDESCEENKRALCQIGIPACGDPGQPLHGNRLPDDRTTYLDGATLHFSCNEGFILSGQEILTCMTSGSWDHQIPFCEAVKCEGMPPNVTRASKSMVEPAYYRDTTVYTCDDGYIPDSEPISFCQHTGNWSIPNFTCSALSPCYSNPCLNGGTCNMDGSSFICTCPEGYIGTTCDEEFNPCDSNPCMNGGSCLESGSSFSCTCSSDYTGPTCDEDGNPATLGAIAAGSSVAVLFIIVLIIFTVVLFRRRRMPKRIEKDDANEMEDYAAVANCYEESKPVNGTPHEPYYLTLVPESDQNGGSVDHVATQPHLGKGGAHKDKNYFVKDLNGWAGSDDKEGFVDNVLYEASDEPTVKPSLLSSNCHKTSNSQGKLSSNHVIDEHHGSRNNKSDATNEDEDDYMIENELYNSTTPQSLNLESMDDQGTHDVYENPDENIYTDCKDDDILIENELYGVPSPTTPRAHKRDAVVDSVNDAVYEDPDKTTSMVENGAVTPAAYENHTVVDEVNDGVYEELNDDAATPRTYINEAVDDEVYEAVGDDGAMVDNELYIPAT